MFSPDYGYSVYRAGFAKLELLFTQRSIYGHSEVVARTNRGIIPLAVHKASTAIFIDCGTSITTINWLGSTLRSKPLPIHIDSLSLSAVRVGETSAVLCSGGDVYEIDLVRGKAEKWVTASAVRFVTADPASGPVLLTSRGIMNRNGSYLQEMRIEESVSSALLWKGGRALVAKSLTILDCNLENRRNSCDVIARNAYELVGIPRQVAWYLGGGDKDTNLYTLTPGESPLEVASGSVSVVVPQLVE